MQTPTPGGLRTALFFGFAASLPGISGFESSANLVEEQPENVFPKTLRNMWVAVSIFNPGMAMLALALIPIAAVQHHEEALLAYMGQLAGKDGCQQLYPSMLRWFSVGVGYAAQGTDQIIKTVK